MVGGAAAANFPLRVLSETANTITLGWDHQDNVAGYVFYADGKRVSNTFDGDRVSVTFHKVTGCVTACYGVEDLASDGISVYPVAPPSKPQCSDLIDNDGDGQVDLADPGCSSPTDNDETNAPPPTSDWIFCANEGARCSFTGTHEVRYGAGGTYFTKTFTDGTACTNAVFGDPIVGTAKHCDYNTGNPPPPPPPPPPGTLNGWQVTPQNVGLAPLGLSCASLPAYTTNPIPANTRIYRQRIVWSGGALSLQNGGITIEQSCMQPTGIGGGTPEVVVLSAPSNSNPNRIIDSELDGSLVGTEEVSKACGLRGLWGEITRTYVHAVGSGICIVSYNGALSYDSIITNNYIGNLRAFGNAAGSGSHNEAGTTRCFRIDSNPSRKNVWDGNWIETDVPANSSGGMFIQSTYGCGGVGNVYLENNLMDGGGNWDLYADGSQYSGQFVATNNRFAPGGYGACAVTGFNWTTWSNNYVNDPSQPDNRGQQIGGC